MRYVRLKRLHFHFHSVHYLCHFFGLDSPARERGTPPPSRRCQASCGQTQPRTRFASRRSPICGCGIQLSFPSVRIRCRVSAPGPPTLRCADGWDGSGTDLDNINKKYNARLAVRGTSRAFGAGSGVSSSSGDWLAKELSLDGVGEWA